MTSSRKIPWAAAGLGLLGMTGVALAGSVTGQRVFDDGTTLNLKAESRPDFDGVWVTVSGVPPKGRTVSRTVIQGNKTGNMSKTTLKTCPGDAVCTYAWPRTAMAAGSNDVSVLYVMTDKSSYITTGTIGQPPAITPTPTPVPDPTPTPAPTPAPSGGNCTDSLGNVLTDSAGNPLTC